MIARLRPDKHIHVDHLPGGLNTQLGQALALRAHHTLLHHRHGRVAAGIHRLAGQIRSQPVGQAMPHHHLLPPLRLEVDFRRKNHDWLRLKRLAKRHREAQQKRNSNPARQTVG